MQFTFKITNWKCELLTPEVVYLGLRISKEGLQQMEEKMNAVMKRAAALQYVTD